MMPTVQLGDVATIERAGVDPAELPPDTRYLGLEHIERGGRIVGHATVGDAELASTKYRFSRDHALFGKLRPNLGKIARPDFDGVSSTDILPIRPGPLLDRDYLTHFLRQPSVVQYAATRATGANLPRLSPAALAAFEIPLPPIEEQRRIAAILDQAETIRTKRRQVLAHLDALTQATFHAMFRQFTPNGAVFGEVAVVQGGLQVSAKRATLPIGAPYLRVANVHRGRLKLSEIKTLSLTQAELQRTTLRAGDLLFVEGHANPREIGRVAMWDGSIDGCTHQNHLIRGRVDASRCDPVFAEFWLNSQAGAEHFRRAGKTTSGLNTISASTVKTAPMLTPPLALQREFAERVGTIKGQRGRVERALAADEELFASLQSRAFRGEL